MKKALSLITMVLAFLSVALPIGNTLGDLDSVHPSNHGVFSFTA